MSEMIVVNVRKAKKPYGRYSNFNIIPAHKVVVNLSHVVTITPCDNQVKIRLIEDKEIIADVTFDEIVSLLEL